MQKPSFRTRALMSFPIAFIMVLNVTAETPSTGSIHGPDNQDKLTNSVIHTLPVGSGRQQSPGRKRWRLPSIPSDLDNFPRSGTSKRSGWSTISGSTWIYFSAQFTQISGPMPNGRRNPGTDVDRRSVRRNRGPYDRQLSRDLCQREQAH